MEVGGWGQYAMLQWFPKCTRHSNNALACGCPNRWARLAPNTGVKLYIGARSLVSNPMISCHNSALHGLVCSSVYLKNLCEYPRLCGLPWVGAAYGKTGVCSDQRDRRERERNFC